MATQIKLKRRRRTTLQTVKIDEGEPFYDLTSKHLYVGNSSQEQIENKKHIAEVSQPDPELLKFQIGEDENNVIDLSSALKWKNFSK